jgi:hypothetical protein
MLFRKPKKPTGLDEAINEVLSEMKGFTSDADEYSTMVEQLVKLYSLQTCEKPQGISKDTMLIVAGNLLGIVMILSYEKTNVITTKALQFMLKKGAF